MLTMTRICGMSAVALLTSLMALPRPVLAQSPPAQDSTPRFVEIVADLVNVEGDNVVLHAAEAPGKFWIGLRCSAVEGALRAQIGLAEGKGLVVDEVMPDSPAKKAGIQQYDVLLKFGDLELSSVSDLIDVVQKAEKKEVEVSLLRAGKPQTLKVTPDERAAGSAPTRIAVVAEPDVEYRQLHSLIEKLQKSGPQGDLRWQILQPNVIVNKRQISAIPKGMSISITKSGDEEAKIVVQRGDDKWEATEKTLDKLPEDVRKSVEQFLGARAQPGSAIFLGAPAGRGGSANRYSVQSRVATPPAAGGGVGAAVFETGRTQKQLDEIKKQLEELRKAVETLQSKKE